MTHEFDAKLRQALQEDPIPVPEHVHQRTEALLQSLPEKESTGKLLRFPRSMQRMVASAACFLFVMMTVVLPNTSVAYAKAVEDIPVLGKLVQVFTIRNYDYPDRNHELEADIPSVNDPSNKAPGDLINQDVSALTDSVIAAFYADAERYGEDSVAALHISHETLCSSDSWFTLQLNISEAAASSNSTIRIYHIDRMSGRYVSFADLFDGESRKVLQQLIHAEMKAQMEADANVSYWEELENDPSFAALEEDQNFYFAENGDLVIVYDEFEVGPGSMGNPAFVIAAADCAELVAAEYADLF